MEFFNIEMEDKLVASFATKLRKYFSGVGGYYIKNGGAHPEEKGKIHAGFAYGIYGTFQ